MQNNDQNIIVFGKEWFEKYQSRLLFLLNNKWTKRWFRYVMRIRKHDCSIDTKINLITPNSFSFNAKKKGKKIELTTDFRTHDKYSKRLYYAFKPFWYLLHFFDWAMLDRVEQLTKLSFGFSTLTQYPGSIGIDNPVAGKVGRTGVNENWATLIAGAGNDKSTGANNYMVRFSTTATSGNFWGLERGIFCFDTSGLTAGATISAAVMSLYGQGNYNDGGWSPTFDIYTATPAATNALANADYGQIGTTSQTGSPIAYASFSGSGYNAFTFNATGRGNVSKTGISQFGAREATYDVAGSAPSWSASKEMSVNIYYSNETGGSPDPKLVVTYTVVASGGNKLTLLGTGN